MARTDRIEPTSEPDGLPDVADKPEGPISAAIIAAGIGAAALGLFTTLAEASATVKDWLQWNDRVGPLSGKTLLAVAFWLMPRARSGGRRRRPPRRRSLSTRRRPWLDVVRGAVRTA